MVQTNILFVLLSNFHLFQNFITAKTVELTTYNKAYAHVKLWGIKSILLGSVNEN